MPALSKEKKEQIVELVKKGVSIKEIAQTVGCSEATVSRYRKTLLPAISNPTLSLRFIDALEKKQRINLLDVARDMWDVAEIGTTVGLAVAGVVDDLSSIFDRRLPYSKRVAKGMRGASALASILAGAVEGLSQLSEKREIKITKEEEQKT